MDVVGAVCLCDDGGELDQMALLPIAHIAPLFFHPELLSLEMQPKLEVLVAIIDIGKQVLTIVFITVGGRTQPSFPFRSS
jgi:hypothetical protein